MTPLVSVITPTWQRHDLLRKRCIPSVKVQTYAHLLEHIVVSDGPDIDLVWPLATAQVRYLQLPEHDPSPDNWGSAARNFGYEQARGSLIAYLDDDNAYRPNHVQALAEALLANPEADFAYSQLVTHPQDRVIGGAEPAYGAIDTSVLMHRAGHLEKFGYWPLAGQVDMCGDQHAPDWGVVARWLDAGARWVHVPQVTVDYYFAGS